MDVLILDIVRNRVDSQTQEEPGEGVGKRFAKAAPLVVYKVQILLQ